MSFKTQAELVAFSTGVFYENTIGAITPTNFQDMNQDNWDWVMGINFNGVVNSTRAFIPHMIDSSEAAIINTSSIFGMVAVPGQTVYHATKFAVRGFTESLVLEMKQTNPNLQIHCVHPGHIGTNIAATFIISIIVRYIYLIQFSLCTLAIENSNRV